MGNIEQLIEERDELKARIAELVKELDGLRTWARGALGKLGEELATEQERIAELEEAAKEDERRHAENQAFIDERAQAWRSAESGLRARLALAEAETSRWQRATLALIERDG